MDIVQNLPEGSDRATEDDEQGTSSRGGEPGLPKSWRGSPGEEGLTQNLPFSQRRQSFLFLYIRILVLPILPFPKWVFLF